MSYEHVGLRVSRKAGEVPNAAQIGEGELAFNLADHRVFTRFGNDVVDITDGYTRGEIDERFNGVAGELAQRLTIASVVDSLDSDRTDRPLAASQGRALRVAIDAINVVLASPDTTLDEFREIVAYIKANRADLESLSVSNIAGLEDALAGKVERQSGKALSTNDYTDADRARVQKLGTMADRDVFVAQRAPTPNDGADGDLWFQH